MKELALGVCLLFCAIVTHAQKTPEVSYSPAFEEPEKGLIRLLMLKNGNTVFLHFDKKQGINIAIYDSTHRKKAESTLRSKMWRISELDHSTLEGLYESNGQIVIFMSQIIPNSSLFRILVNSTTGKLEDEANIGEQLRTGTGAGYATAFGKPDFPGFAVSKDPASDYYAVVRYNIQENDRNGRMLVRHYSPDHKELNTVLYESPGGKYKNLRFADMYVCRDEFVFLLTFGYNSRSSSGRDSRVFMGRLAKGQQKFESKTIDYANDFESVYAISEYDASHKMLQVLLAAELNKNARKEMGLKKSAGERVAFLNYIDPLELKIARKVIPDPARISEYQHERQGKKDEFEGALRGMKINADGSTSILLEELTSMPTFSSGSSITTHLNDIGILKLDALGQEISGYAIRKHGYHTSDGGGFYNYRYLNTGGFEYVIFNDLSSNIEEKDWRKEPKRFLTISDLHTACYRKKGNDIEKFYLFKGPKENPDDINRFAKINSMVINEDNKNIVVMIIERKGRNKQARLAWANFE